jgi:hypothetical protein
MEARHNYEHVSLNALRFCHKLFLTALHIKIHSIKIAHKNFKYEGIINECINPVFFNASQFHLSCNPLIFMLFKHRIIKTTMYIVYFFKKGLSLIVSL